MSLVPTFRDNPTPRSEERDTQPDEEKLLGQESSGSASDDLAGAIFGQQREAPAKKGDRAILTAYHTTPSLFSPLTKIAEAVAETEWYLTDDGDEVDDHPVLDLIDDPNREQSGYEWKFLNQLYLELLGESFNVTNEVDGEIELLPIPPTEVKRNRSGLWKVDYNNLRAEVDDEQTVIVKRADLRDPLGGRGSGIGRVLMDEIEITEYASEHEKMEFANNARPDFMMILPGASSDNTKKFQSRWRQLFRGPNNTGKGAFFGGPPDQKPIFEEVSRKLKDMEVGELRGFSEEMIRRTPGVPPEIMGVVENSNRATIENAELIFEKFTVKPRLRHLQHEWQQNLLPLFDNTEGLTLEFRERDPEQTTIKQNIMKEHPEAFTVNEMRDLAGEAPREDGDVYLRPPEQKQQVVEAQDTTNGGADGSVSSRATDGPQAKDGPLSSADDETIIEVKGWRQKQPDLNPEEIAQRLTPEFIEAEWANPYEDEVQQWVERTQREIGVQPDFTVVNPMIREHVQEFGAERVKDINETTRQQIRDVLEEGIDEGLGSQEIAGKLDSFYEGQVLGSRAEVIARTEMGRAAGWATDQAHKASDVVDRQEWIATMDSRVRPEHASMDGQITPIDDPFEAPGGSTAKGACSTCQYPIPKFPGGFGIARLDIQCRCTIAAVIGERDFQRLIEKGAAPGYLKSTPARVVVENEDGTMSRPSTRKEVWKAYDDALDAAERRFLPVIRDGLRKQKAQQLDPALKEALDLQDAA